MLRGDARMRTRRSHTRAPSGLGLVDPEHSDVATIDGGHARPPTAPPRQGEEPMQNPIPLTGFIQIAVVVNDLSLIHISEPTRLGMISYAVFCLKKKKK